MYSKPKKKDNKKDQLMDEKKDEKPVGVEGISNSVLTAEAVVFRCVLFCVSCELTNVLISGRGFVFSTV